jgi:catechol 2,3-dioxygenase-like lactoylglutathione lyase family enzyme
MIKGLHHVGLSVVNLDRSVEFYRDLLGTDVVNHATFAGPQYESILRLEGAKGRSAMLMAPNMRIELFEFARPSSRSRDAGWKASDQGISHFCISIDDINSAYARLVGARSSVNWPPLDFFGAVKATAGRDPDGNLFELLEVSDPASSVSVTRGSNHVCLSVANIDRSIAFYRGLLRMEVVSGVSSFAGEQYERLLGVRDAQGRGAMLSAANMQLELLEFSRPLPKPADSPRPVCDHGITHFCVEVGDIEGEYERLKVAGASFHCPPLDFFGIAKATYGRDPDGNAFELLQVLG